MDTESLWLYWLQYLGLSLVVIEKNAWNSSDFTEMSLFLLQKKFGGKLLCGVAQTFFYP